MKKSPAHPKYEMAFDGSGNRYDPQNDFYQFLEEAKHYALESGFQTSSTFYQEEAGERRVEQEDTKKKKTWKKILFPWFKGEKNECSTKQAAKSQAFNTRRTNVSGPVCGTGKAMDVKQRRPLSGPIASFLKATNREDHEIPYKCLDKTDIPQDVKTYGPVYLVT